MDLVTKCGQFSDIAKDSKQMDTFVDVLRNIRKKNLKERANNKSAGDMLDSEETEYDNEESSEDEQETKDKNCRLMANVMSKFGNAMA